MPAAVPLVVAGATYTGVSAAIGTAIVGATVSATVATAVGAAVVGTGAALATGQSGSDALRTGVMSGVTAGIGGTVGAVMAPGAPELAQQIIGGAVTGAAAYSITGADPVKGAVAGAIGSVTSTTYAPTVGRALGATSDVAAKTVGNAAINAGLSGVQAAVSGGDIGKSMLTGAVAGAAMVNAKDITEAVLGKNAVNSISKSTNLSAPEIHNIFANSVVTAVVAGANDQDMFQAFTNSIISSGVSSSIANAMETSFKNSFDNPEDLAGILATVRGISNVGVNAALYGDDIGQALERSMPGIILSSFQAYERTKAVNDAIRAKEEELNEINRQALQLAFSEEQFALGPAAPIAISVAGHAALGAILYLTDKIKKLFPNDIEAQQEALQTSPVFITLEPKAREVSPNLTIRQTQNPQTKKPEISIEIPNKQELPEPTQLFIERVNAEIAKPSTEIRDISNAVLDVLTETFELPPIPPQERQAFIDRPLPPIDTTVRGRVGITGEAGATGVAGGAPSGPSLGVDVGTIPPSVSRPSTAADREAQLIAAIEQELQQQMRQEQLAGLSEAERLAISQGRDERIERARLLRTEQDIADFKVQEQEFEEALKELEAAIAKARSDEEKAQARQVFTTQQRERLRQTGGLTGDLQAQIDAELGNLLDQYEDAQRRAGRAATQKEGLVAPQQPRDASRQVTDAEVMRLLGLSSEEAERYGFFGDTDGVAGGDGLAAGVEDEGPGSAKSGGELGAGEEGVGPGAGAEGFGPGGGAIDERTRLRPIVIYDQRTGAPRASTGIPQRVTAQSVEGILGDKEPLFGGDDDEQREVWNRRSLRLRKALGL